MRLPGFTAEKVLETENKFYTGVALPSLSESQVVVPQFWRCWGDYCCNEYGYCIHHGHVLM